MSNLDNVIIVVFIICLLLVVTNLIFGYLPDFVSNVAIFVVVLSAIGSLVAIASRQNKRSQ